MKCEYRPVTGSDILELSKNARLLDVQEVSAVTNMSMLQTLEYSVKTSSLCASAYVDGKLNAILGVCPQSLSIINTVGVPWMIGTDLVTENKKVFCSEYSAIIKQMLGEYSLLQNYVDARNKPAITFLKRAGFTIDKAIPFGIKQMPFHRFYKRA